MFALVAPGSGMSTASQGLSTNWPELPLSAIDVSTYLIGSLNGFTGSAGAAAASGAGPSAELDAPSATEPPDATPIEASRFSLLLLSMKRETKTTPGPFAARLN